MFGVILITMYLEGFLVVVVFLQEEPIVHDDLWCGDSKVYNPVIHSFTRLKCEK